jgi:acetyl-CoA carboxylase biotin carboxyl carrier protein
VAWTVTTTAIRSTDASEREGAAPRFDALTEAVRELVQVMREGDIGHLDVRQGDLRISLKSTGFIESRPARHRTVRESVSPGEDLVAVADESGHVITSPMIGTYYAAAGPNEPPFVQVGDRVDAGQTVAIIEAMKIMNEIVSEHSGVVAEIYVRNGEAVEYGHRLIRLKD